MAGSKHLGNRRRRLDAGARNHQHRAFALLDDTARGEFCECRGDTGRGGLHEQANLREPFQGRDDLILGNRHRFSAAVLQGVDHFLQPQRMRDRRAFGDRLLDGAVDRRVDAGLKTRIQRRAVERLRGKQFWQLADLASGQQFGEADVAAEQVAAGTDRDDDVVGRFETKILPDLIGDRFCSLQKERLPVVARIEDLAGLADRLGL